METPEPENQSPFISFTSDYGFKVTFGNEENTIFLRRALQALIGSSVPILKVTFDKTVFDGVTKDGRSGIFDLSCVDEKGNRFIVEMQLGAFPGIYPRIGFYAFQKLNTLVRKGKYRFEGLPKIYAIALMKGKLNDDADYHHISTFKNQKNTATYDGIALIVAELAKFNKAAAGCTTDLDKLFYTMKVLSEAQTEGTEIKYPDFWTEEWLQVAIRELDTRAMSPEKRMAYEMTLVANALAIRQEEEKIAAAKAEGEAKGRMEGEAKGRMEGRMEGEAKGRMQAEAQNEVEKYALKKALVRGLLNEGFSDEKILLLIGETPEFLQKVKADIAEESKSGS